MLFNSYIFVLFFLPVCIIGYFLLNHFNRRTLAQIFLLGMSLWFYAYFHVEYLFIIIASIVGNYVCYLFLCRAEHLNKRKLCLFAGLSLNLGALFYYKYYNFFLENVNVFLKQDFALHKVLLPLGISFFTFQQISFIVDAYKGEVPKYGFLQYASFVAYFPQLIAGPIVTYDELIPQFMDETKKRFSWDNFVKGIYLFTLGLSKKVLLADTFGNAVNWGFANIPDLNGTDAILNMLFYTFQIYFDFSGYCDMAVGIGRMMNIDLPVNFNSPYKALTIIEFWERWHMTLTRFFTKYVYVPFGGNRGGVMRTYVNVMAVFLISGLWHGAGWTFVLWGACHGIFSVITRKYKKWFEAMHPALGWLSTFFFLNVTWVIFRADSIKNAVAMLRHLLLWDFGTVNSEMIAQFRLPEFKTLNKFIPVLDDYPLFSVAFFTMVAIVILLGTKNAYEKMRRFAPTVPKLVLTVFLLTWCIFSFSGISTFIYFNF